MPRTPTMKASTKPVPAQTAVYDATGKLIGSVPPEAIIPIADADPIAKQAAGVAAFQQIRKSAPRR